MSTEYGVIFITAASKKEARRIILELLKKKLIACGNLLSSVDSIFIWKGKTEKAKEVLIMLKTKASLFKKIAAEVKKLHSYEVPEIIAVPIIEGNREYLGWINKNVK